MSIILPIVVLLLTVAALVTCISSDEGDLKHMPKLVWVLLIVFLPLIGSIVFFAVGRDWSTFTMREARDGEAHIPDRWDRERDRERTRPKKAHEPLEELDDEARIEAEIAFHEQQAEIRRLEAKLKAEREARGQ